MKELGDKRDKIKKSLEESKRRNLHLPPQSLEDNYNSTNSINKINNNGSHRRTTINTTSTTNSSGGITCRLSLYYSRRVIFKNNATNFDDATSLRKTSSLTMTQD